MKRIRKLGKRTMVVAALLALALFAAALVIRKKRALAAAPKFGERPTPVHVVKAVKGDLDIVRTYLAVCEPVQKADVSARITARIDKVLCDEGTPAKIGQVLIQLDDREIREDIAAVSSEIQRTMADLAGNEAMVESLRQSVAYWKREAARDKTLADHGDIPGSQAEGTAEKENEFRGRLLSAEQKSRALEHQSESLQRRKKQLEVQLSYCEIRSPYNGLVTRRLVDPGDLAAPGKPLLVVEDRSSLKLSFDVPQFDLPEVREGLDLRFSVEGSPRKGAITHLYPSLASDRTMRAESVVAPDQARGLACGAYAPVSVIVRHLHDVVLVPSSCLVEGPDGAIHVFVVRDGKLAHPPVKVLGRGADKAALEGIKAGEQVVKNTFLGWSNLAGGMKLQPIP